MTEEFPSVAEHVEASQTKIAKVKKVDLASETLEDSLAGYSMQQGQLSLRALFFIIIQAAVISMIARLALEQNTTPRGYVVFTFVAVTILSASIGLAIGFRMGIQWWYGIGPLTGTIVGLVASLLTIASPTSFDRVMNLTLISALGLVFLACIVGRQMDQEELD